MRARHRHFLASLFAAVVVTLTPALFAPSAVASYQAATCPGSTSWDNILQRCV